VRHRRGGGGRGRGGTEVVGVDLAPALIDTARAGGGARGADLRGARLDTAYRIGRGLLGPVLQQLWPEKTLADSLGERREELRRAWVDLFATEYRDGDEVVHARVPALVLGRRR
jgi:hypothetical protein